MELFIFIFRLPFGLIGFVLVPIFWVISLLYQLFLFIWKIILFPFMAIVKPSSELRFYWDIEIVTWGDLVKEFNMIFKWIIVDEE